MGDKAVHGEEAFALFGEPTKLENMKHNKIYDTHDFSFVGESKVFNQLQMV
uniref:Uncharacterized protein n=1 Tax=Cajanus cajan TaxID=3821 RepID=A0A151TXK1_CAJCA|nr:hypothetical protein KK1_011076 [Cajanus cajan]